MLIIIAGILAYIACAVLTYGLTLAYFQEHHYSVRSKRDGSIARIMALFPTGLIIALVQGEWGYHGFQWRATEAGRYIRDDSHPANTARWPRPHNSSEEELVSKGRLP